jgi:hypothetical protein
MSAKEMPTSAASTAHAAIICGRRMGEIVASSHGETVVVVVVVVGTGLRF